MLTVLLSDLLGWLLQVPMAETAPTGAGQLWASQWSTDADFSGLVRRTGARTEARTSVPNSLVNLVFGLNGAAQESNLPSVGLRRRTGFEDQLGHRPPPLRR